MVGKRKKQVQLFDVGNVFDLELPTSSFYAQLAVAGPTLFPDEAFADLYSEDHGRPSVPPGQMALLMLLQYYESLSDEAAVEHSAFDLRWAAVLGRPAGQRLCGRTTLILFRARLAFHDAQERLFDQALQQARERGLLPAQALRIILDTKPVIGRGAVEDTYNLLARALDRVIRRLAEAAGQPVAEWAAAHAVEEYVRHREQSLKGAAAIDWSDAGARRKLLTEIVAAARRVLAASEAVLPSWSEEAAREVRKEAELLRAILAQDVVERPKPGGKGEAEVAEGTARDRIPSATDPDQRHGHKSASRQFTGHKARVAVDAESQLIVDVEVLAGNAGDAEGALAQVERVEKRLDTEVAETMGDCAFGGGATRQEFAAAGRELHAKMPASAGGTQLPKSRFTLLFEGREVVAVRCPNGEETRQWKPRVGGGRVFTFGSCCKRCPLRHVCLGQRATSRTIQIHPQEYLLQAAREYQASEAGRCTLRQRVTAEHALARLARLGIGQARYFGRKKTRFQLLLAATVVNLRWTWNWAANQATHGPAEPGLRPGSASGRCRSRSLRPWWRRLVPTACAPAPPSRVWDGTAASRALTSCHHF